MTSKRYISLLLPLIVSSSHAFLPGIQRTALTVASRVSPVPLRMAIDYNDPAVAEEFASVQMMEYDDVVAELMQSGVRAPPDMGDVEVKLMLVELRTVMKSGDGGSTATKTKPSSYASKFEEYMWEKPFFAELYESLKRNSDHNQMNVAAEYCNDPENARQRYYKAYTKLIDDIDAALIAKPEVTSPRVKFSGFPANMGDMGLKMTLEALGEVVDMSCSVSDDGLTLMGDVTFGSVDIAKAAIEQYDGMDMGMGDKLQMVSS
ncbi:hypothetical protein ACHAWX_000582 [Stephanocyclus meneghinianus]